MPKYKLWIQVEEEMDDGEHQDVDLPFTESATFTDIAEAIGTAITVHDLVNQLIELAHALKLAEREH